MSWYKNILDRDRQTSPLRLKVQNSLQKRKSDRMPNLLQLNECQENQSSICCCKMMRHAVSGFDAPWAQFLVLGRVT